MLDLLLPVAGGVLLAFLDEEQQFRVLLLLLGAVAVLVLISINESLQEVAALGYEIRNLRAYMRPRTVDPVARPSSPASAATPPVVAPVDDAAAGSSVQPATEGTE